MLNIAKILSKPKMKPGHFDDLKIVRSWAEYTEGQERMTYLMYELEMADANGPTVHFFKAIKFTRIIRLPKSAKQSQSFMDMHSQILSSLWEQSINLVAVIANMIKPVALGVLYLYGVQGTGNTAEEAKRVVDVDYITMCSALQGTYRVLEHRILTYQELEWLREKMFTMKNMTALRGIPKANKGGVQTGKEGMGAKNINPDSHDTTEEFIAGMSDKEYVVQILSTPVRAEHLERWLAQTANEMTKWNQQLQGSTSINFSLSLPMMYMANLGASQGWVHTGDSRLCIIRNETISRYNIHFF